MIVLDTDLLTLVKEMARELKAQCKLHIEREHGMITAPRKLEGAIIVAFRETLQGKIVHDISPRHGNNRRRHSP
jgi:hypothetical protein